MRQTTRKTLLFWAPPAAWASAIFVVSSLSFAPQPDLIPHADKIAHMLIYAILSLLTFRALHQGQGLPPWTSAVLAVVVASLYGVTDELHQYFVPDRKTDVLDWLADTAGACAALAAARSGRKKELRHPEMNLRA